MAATFTYTDARTFSQVNPATYTINDTSPAPGRMPTNVSIVMQAAAQKAYTVQIVQLGGSGANAILASGTVAAGATTSTYTFNGNGTVDLTGVRLRGVQTGGLTVPYTINATISVTYSDAVPPAPCQYGTRPKADTSLVLPIGGAILNTVLGHFAKPWLGTLFGSIVGSSMAMDTLCNTIPPSWPAIDIGALLNSDAEKLVLFQSLAWHVFCECTPGPTTPTPYTEPNPVQPPNWPVYGPEPCTNSDICATLLEILKRLDYLSSSQNLYIDHRTILNNPRPTLAFKVGAVHTGLTGSGTLTISKLIGIRLQLTANVPGHSLEGNPPYIWDVGWMSVSDGGAMLQERRITRALYEWFPGEMSIATTWGYFFKGAEIATMTELLPA